MKLKLPEFLNNAEKVARFEEENERLKKLLLAQRKGARKIADGLKNAAQLVTVDGVTGAFSSRHAEFVYRRLVNQCMRDNYDAGPDGELISFVGIAMVDIDHFKNVNDTLGHNAGDTTLKTLVQKVNKVIIDTLRSSDDHIIPEKVNRDGGEEFIVLTKIKARDKKEAARMMAKLAERLRVAVADTSFEHDEETYKITISCGVDVVKPETALPRVSVQTMGLNERLYYKEARGTADGHLYLAKNNGRDCVIFLGVEQNGVTRPMIFGREEFIVNEMKPVNNKTAEANMPSVMGGFLLNKVFFGGSLSGAVRQARETVRNLRPVERLVSWYKGHGGFDI